MCKGAWNGLNKVKGVQFGAAHNRRREAFFALLPSMEKEDHAPRKAAILKITQLMS
jgi:hypothetical protein